MPAAVVSNASADGAVALSAPPVIEIADVAKTFNGRNVLDGVSLTVRRGETLVIMGASGCGKSTLLRCLIGAHSVDKGSVKLFGKDIAALRQRDLDAVRKRYGILFQSGALFSSMTVGENVALPLKEHTRLSADMIDLMVKVKLELVGLREAEDRLPSEISGGMAKRAGLARAIALDPELLFYDEPTSGLDPIMTGIIDSLITDLARTMSVTSVVVTHDLQSAFRVADRMVVLNNGRIVLQGLPHEIRASNDAFVRRFIHGPVESKTVMLPRGPLGIQRAGAGFLPNPGAALVSSGINRAVAMRPADAPTITVPFNAATAAQLPSRMAAETRPDSPATEKASAASKALDTELMAAPIQAAAPAPVPIPATPAPAPEAMVSRRVTIAELFKEKERHDRELAVPAISNSESLAPVAGSSADMRTAILPSPGIASANETPPAILPADTAGADGSERGHGLGKGSA